ncbi:MAG: PIN domain-containing protein [Acidobacteriota bacterium]
MIGVDTGFFFALSEGHTLATQVFRDSEIAVSVLSRFELLRISLRRGLPWQEIGGLLERSAVLVEVTGETADEAARLSFETGIPALDSLILASLLKAGCRTIYTRDEHFTKYTQKGVEIVLLA